MKELLITSDNGSNIKSTAEFLFCETEPPHFQMSLSTRNTPYEPVPSALCEDSAEQPDEEHEPSLSQQGGGTEAARTVEK